MKTRQVLKALLPSVMLFATGIINIHMGSQASNTVALTAGYVFVLAAFFFAFPLILCVYPYRQRRKDKEKVREEDIKD